MNIGASNKAIINLGKNAFNKEQEIKDLNFRILELTNNLKSKQEENNLLLDKVTLLENTTIKELKLNIEDLNKLNNNLIKENKALEDKLYSYKNISSTVDNKLKMFSDTINELQIEIKELKCKNDKYIRDNNIYRIEIKENEKYKNKLEEEVINLNDILHKSDVKIKTLEGIIKKNEHYIDVLKSSKHKSFNKNISNINTNNCNKRNNLNNLKLNNNICLCKDNMIIKELNKKENLIAKLQKNNLELNTRLRNYIK